MPEKIIIYGSHYGTAKKYAEELSLRTGIEVKPYNEIAKIDTYNVIVYIGALYAGSLVGMKKTFSKLTACKNKKIIIISVGLADVKDKHYTDDIKKSISRQISKEVYENASIYHLRGGIDYSKLSFVYKTMMGLLYKKVIALPEEKRTADANTLIETYNKKVDFVDFSSLDIIIKEQFMERV